VSTAAGHRGRWPIQVRRPAGPPLQNFQPTAPSLVVSARRSAPEISRTGGCRRRNRPPRPGFQPPAPGGGFFGGSARALRRDVASGKRFASGVRTRKLSPSPRRSSAFSCGRQAGRGVGGTARSGRRRGRDLGAARDGYRKRTRVRVACGGAIRPRGVGTHASHGHFGRSVVGSRCFPPVVLRSERRREPCVRHLSRGPGLPAAALTTFRHFGFVRLSALADRTVRATRLAGPVVNRAASLPAPTVGSSRGWRRRTRPGPRTRLRRAARKNK
jgi:hypothetical protein